MIRRLLPGSDLDDSSLQAIVGRGLTPVAGATETWTVTYLDTFDWRLWRSHLTLIEETGPERRLVLLEQDRAPFVVGVADRPTRADDLPSGHLADRVAKPIGIRALIPVGTALVTRRDGRIDDPAGDMVARLRVEKVEPIDRCGRPAGRFSTIELRGLRGTALDPRLDGLTAAAEHDLEAVAAAGGRHPGDYSSKLDIALDPAARAELSLRTILLDLLGTLEANVEGTAADLDTEFLHDLRVACRRTRSALTQLEGVLPQDVTDPFNAEFKWLGNVTGPQRDLDVYLLEMPGYRSMLPADAARALDPLEELIRSERSRAQRAVARALRSARFERLLDGWRRTLASDEPSPAPDAARPTSDLARERIAKAHRRILKHGRKLGDDPPAAALHRLRIDAKKLRYLLEFFKRLYPEAEIGERIGELKRLQDILGGCNDMEVQSTRLSAFARELHADPATDAGCLLALGRLAGALDDRREGYRRAFHGAFEEFSGPTVRAGYRRLFGGKEPA